MRDDEHSPLVADEHTPLVADGEDGRRADANRGWDLALVAALSTLTLANLATQATRFLLNFLYMEEKKGASADPHINIALDLGMTPTEFGLLSGPLLLVVIVVSSVFIGSVADDVRVGPRTVLVGGMLLQGVAMCAQGLVTSMPALFAVRFVFAVGQAAVTAPGLSLIAQNMPKLHHPTANSAFGTGVYLGSGLAAAGGILALKVGWRITSAVFGGLCFLSALAVACAVSTGPKSRGVGGGVGGLGADVTVKAAAIWNGLRLWGASWSSRTLVVAGSLRFFAGFSTASFLPVYLEDQYSDKTLMLTWYGVITAVAGVASSLLGGYITQGSLLAVPFSLCLLYASQSLSWALMFFLGKVLVGECWAGPAMSIVQSMVPKEGGTSGVASYLALLTLVGTLGPLVVGALHDRGWQLRTLLFVAVTCPFAGAGALFVGLALANPDGFFALAEERLNLSPRPASQSPASLSDDGESGARGGDRDDRAGGKERRAA